MAGWRARVLVHHQVPVLLKRIRPLPELMKKLLLILATGFGLGNAPVASGTFGSLPGLLLILVLPLCSHVWIQAVYAIVLVAVAIPLCSAAEHHFEKKDDGRIVADEYLCFPLALVGIPFQQYWLFVAFAFVVARGFDIVKITPAREAQSLQGGLGIVLDDAAANVYALIVNHLAWWLLVAPRLSA